MGCRRVKLCGHRAAQRCYAPARLFECLEAGDTIDDFYFPTVTRQQVVVLLETAKGRVLAEVK